MPRSLGIVLCGGRGERLRPLTHAQPKPLLPILDRSLLERHIRRLTALGVDEIVITVHHLAERVAQAVRDLDVVTPIRIHWQPALNGPAGVLPELRAVLADFDLVVVVSGDILLSSTLQDLLATHVTSGAALTFGSLRTSYARRFGVLDVEPDGSVTGMREKPDVPDGEIHSVSAGVYCMRPDAVIDLPTTEYLDYAADVGPHLLSRGRSVIAHALGGAWTDVGTSEAFLHANFRALDRACEVVLVDGATCSRDTEHGVVIYHGPETRIAPTAVLRGSVVLGRGCMVGPGATLENVVVLPGAEVGFGATYRSGICLGNDTAQKFVTVGARGRDGQIP